MRGEETESSKEMVVAYRLLYDAGGYSMRDSTAADEASLISRSLAELSMSPPVALTDVRVTDHDTCHIAVSLTTLQLDPAPLWCRTDWCTRECIGARVHAARQRPSERWQWPSESWQWSQCHTIDAESWLARWEQSTVVLGPHVLALCGHDHGWSLSRAQTIPIRTCHLPNIVITPLTYHHRSGRRRALINCAVVVSLTAMNKCTWWKSCCNCSKSPRPSHTKRTKRVICWTSKKQRARPSHLWNCARNSSPSSSCKYCQI